MQIQMISKFQISTLMIFTYSASVEKNIKQGKKSQKLYNQ